MQDPKPRHELTHHNGTHHESGENSQEQGAKTHGAGPSMPLPKTEADHAALPVVEGPLQPGALVAYKLLEIGPDWAPQVFTLLVSFFCIGSALRLASPRWQTAQVLVDTHHL